MTAHFGSQTAAVLAAQAGGEGAASACPPVRAAADVPGWLLCQIEANALLIGAVGTILLVILGLVRLSLWLLRDDGYPEDRTEGADARIANLAFPVRRTLAKSLDEGWRLEDDYIYQRDRAREIQRGFVEHETRVEEMLTAANDASPEITDASREAARLFWGAADGVNDMAAFEPQHMGHSPSDGVLEGYREAKSATEKCVEILRRLDAPVREAGN